MMEKEMDTENKGLQHYFLLTSQSVKTLLNFSAHLKYCRGVNTIERKELRHL